MNRKELILLLFGVLVAGGAGLLVFNQNASSWQHSQASGSGGSAKVLKEFAANDVAQIQIKSAQSEVNLLKSAEGWTVKERAGYPANFDQIADLVRKLWELKAVQTVKAGPSQFGRLNLELPGPEAKSPGTLVDLKDAKGTRIRALLLGKIYSRGEAEEGGFPAGRYLLPLDDSKQVMLVSEPFQQVAAEAVPASPSIPPTASTQSNPAAQWLDHSFFKIEHVKSLALTGTSPETSWKLTRESESADWKLEGLKEAEELDKTKTAGLSSSLGFPEFVDVAAPETKLENPTTIAVETFDGFTYSIQLGNSNEATLPLKLTLNATLPKERAPGKEEKPADKERLDKQFADSTKLLQEKLGREKKLEGRIYLVSKASFESFFKKRSELLAEKKAPEPAATAPATPPVAQP